MDSDTAPLLPNEENQAEELGENDQVVYAESDDDLGNVEVPPPETQNSPADATAGPSGIGHNFDHNDPLASKDGSKHVEANDDKGQSIILEENTEGTTPETNDDPSKSAKSSECPWDASSTGAQSSASNCENGTFEASTNQENSAFVNSDALQVEKRIGRGDSGSAVSHENRPDNADPAAEANVIEQIHGDGSNTTFELRKICQLSKKKCGILLVCLIVSACVATAAGLMFDRISPNECNPPPAIVNGTCNCSSFNIGTVCNYSCKNNLVIRGHKEVTCGADLRWRPEVPPTCVCPACTGGSTCQYSTDWSRVLAHIRVGFSVVIYAGLRITCVSEFFEFPLSRFGWTCTCSYSTEAQKCVGFWTNKNACSHALGSTVAALVRQSLVPKPCNVDLDSPAFRC